MDAPALGPRYQPLYRLAAGGMAEVWVGAQKVAAAQRPVAIKRILPQFADNEKYVRMFLDEAHLAACIDSPNVVSLIDADVAEDGAPFLVMELVEGISLSTLLRTKGHPMSEGMVCYIVKQAALGLHDAHEARAPSGEPLELVHRDVSPHNLLLGVDGRVRLADFGVAHALERMTLTVSGEFKGKLAYCAPEQLHGDVDRRADIFSLGIVIRQALSGERLFGPSSSNVEAMQKLLNEEIRPTKVVAPHIGDELAAAIDKALRRDPNQRYDTAADFADALSPFATATRQNLGALIEAAGGAELKQRRDKTTEIFASLKAGSYVVETPPPAEASQASAASLAETVPLAEGELSAGTPVAMVELGRPSRARFWVAISAVFALAVAVGVAMALQPTESQDHDEVGGLAAESEVQAPTRAAAPAVVHPAAPERGTEERDPTGTGTAAAEVVTPAAGNMRAARTSRDPREAVATVNEEPTGEPPPEPVTMNDVANPSEMTPDDNVDEPTSTMRRDRRLVRDVF